MVARGGEGGGREDGTGVARHGGVRVYLVAQDLRRQHPCPPPHAVAQWRSGSGGWLVEGVCGGGLPGTKSAWKSCQSNSSVKRHSTCRRTRPRHPHRRQPCQPSRSQPKPKPHPPHSHTRAWHPRSRVLRTARAAGGRGDAQGMPREIKRHWRRRRKLTSGEQMQTWVYCRS